MTVFVVQDSPGKNLTPAMKYGKIEVLSPAGDRPFSIDIEVRRIYDKLRSYRKGDYILPIGDPVLIGIAVALACEKTQGHVKILKYDRQEKSYIPIAIDLVNILKDKINAAN